MTDGSVANRTSRRLGWIKPDDGVRVAGQVLDYECFTLHRWLEAHDVCGVEPVIEMSTAEALHTPEDLLATGELERLIPVGCALAEAGCEAVIWACTSGSFVGGLRWAREQAASLTERAGVPASSTSLAIADALTHEGVDIVDVLSPYPRELTDRLTGFLREAGVAVGVQSLLQCPTGSASHRLDIAAEVERFDSEHPATRHPLLIPDTAVNTLDHVEGLEHRLGRPVYTANQITLWKGLEMMGLPREVSNAGSLLRVTVTMENQHG